MGISVALTPATTVVTVSKSMITNASFRTKKLPGEFTLNLTLFSVDRPQQYFLMFRQPKSPTSHVLLSAKKQFSIVLRRTESQLLGWREEKEEL